MVFSYLNILIQSVAIIDSTFNFGNFFTKNAITFDQKEIERKKICMQEILLGIECCNKNVKIARKKINFFFKIFSTKSTFCFKIHIFRKHNVYFQILGVLPVIMTTYLPV